MTVDEAFSLAARLDLGECDSREDLVAKLRERRAGVIADLIALFGAATEGVGTRARIFDLRAARLAELALVEEALAELGELDEGPVSSLSSGARGEGETSSYSSSGSPSSGEAARG